MKYFMSTIKNTLTMRLTTKWLTVLLLLMASNITLAKLTQSIDRTEIHAGETFLLTLQVDEDTGEEPDLSLIPKEFTIVSNSQYQQMSYVNGRSSVIKGWKIKLSTLVTGKIIIPSITVGNEQTTAIIINVKDTSDRVDLNGKKKAIFLESGIDQKQSYVQQQIIFTVKLFRAVNTHYARLTEPSAGESIIEKLGDDIQYDKQIDNTRYVVTERRYAIFPQKSGELTIESINFTADVNDPSSRGSNRFLNTTRPISVNSKAIKIKVLPQPAKAVSPWMPALEVVLADKWSQTTNELTIGEPVTWTILLYAQGLSESQLPEINLPKVAGLQFYPDTPQKERQINDRGILGQRIEKLAVIPSKEGSITIPEIKVKWWDTQSNSEKTATIAAKTFNIIAAEGSLNETTPIEKIGPKLETVTIIDDSQTFYWKVATGGFLLLWLMTLLAFIKNKNNPVIKKKSTKTNSDKMLEVISQSQLYKNLKKSIKAQESSLIENDLLAWASSLSSTPIHSLGLLMSSIKDAPLKEKLSKLQSQRYSKGKQQYQCDISDSDLKHIVDALDKTDNKENFDGIPPLYHR